MDYRDQIERLKHQSHLVATRLAGQLPDSLVEYWRQSERPTRWGMVGALMGAGFFGLLAPLFILVALMESPTRVFAAIQVLVTAGGTAGVYYGLLGYVIGQRSRTESVGPIIKRVIAAHLIGLIIPVVGVFAPFIAVFWRTASRVTRGTEVTSVSALQRYLKKTEDNYLRQRNLSAIEPKFQIGGVELPGYLEQLGCFMVGYL